MPGTAPLAQLDQAVGLCDVMECQFCGLAHLGFVTHQSRRKLWSTVQAGSIIAQASIRGLPPLRTIRGGQGDRVDGALRSTKALGTSLNVPPAWRLCKWAAVQSLMRLDPQTALPSNVRPFSCNRTGNSRLKSRCPCSGSRATAAEQPSFSNWTAGLNLRKASIKRDGRQKLLTLKRFIVSS